MHVLWLIFLMLSGVSFGQEPSDAPAGQGVAPLRDGRVLHVGYKPAPPFVMRADDGSWYGIAVELWEKSAKDLGLNYEVEEVTLKQLLARLDEGSLDVGVAALTVTAKREGMFDFTHPYFPSGLGIAVKGNTEFMFTKLVRRLLSPNFFKAVGTLVVVLLTAGLAVWWFERKENVLFRDGSMGLFDSFWWAAVTMTTVGYGDMTPKTVPGRLIALLWMFTSIIVISSLTAAISSALTISKLDTPIDGPEDLTGVRVGTVAASTSAKWVAAQRLYSELYDTPEQAMDALGRGEVEAVVYDAPVLQYIALKHEGDLVVVPRMFDEQNYAFGLSDAMEHDEQLDQHLLEELESPWWSDVLYRYLGR